MFYETKIDIPANTPKADPFIVVLTVTKGILHRFWTEYPSGCQGLAHLVIRHAESQMIPTNPDGDLAADNYVLEAEEFIAIEAPYVLKLVGWNEDDTYSHTLTFRCSILPPEIVAPSLSAEQLAQVLQEMFTAPPTGG